MADPALVVFSPTTGDVNIGGSRGVWAHAGVPVNGTSGTAAGEAHPGDLLVDTTNFTFYQNSGTTASPTWTQEGGSGAPLVGTFDGVVGGNAPNTGTFTAVTTSGLDTAGSRRLDTGTKTAAATAGAATLSKSAGVITSEALVTAAGAIYTLTLTNTTIAAADQVMASVQLGTATTGMPVVTTVTPGAGSVVIVVQNIHASAALNGTIKIAFLVMKN